MTDEQRRTLEDRIRQEHVGGNIRGAIALAIEGYGAEMNGFLLGRADSADDAAEAYCMFEDDLLAQLKGFEWRSSFRTWAYKVAHHALARFHKGAARRATRETSLMSHQEVLAKSRSLTAEWAKTSVKDAFRELRRKLSEEDQTILILRVDRELAWRDIAEVIGQIDTDAAPPAALKIETNRIKKRFERARNELRRIAIEQGLITPGE